MSQPQRDASQPLNAQIINDGAGRQDAIDLGSGIWMSKDVSNLYLVTTADGNVLINTGIIYSAAENKRRFDAVSKSPIRKIIFTQSHEDHIGGWSTFNAPDVETIGQANLPFVRTQYRDLGPVMSHRSRRLWSRDQKQEITERPEPVLTTSFHNAYSFELGGRRIELYSVPGGETVDSLVVWLPQDRVVFTGNMTGPIFGHVPNLYTVRGERYRYVQWYLDSVRRVIDLAPDVLITGHGEPVRGAAKIRDSLTAMFDAAKYLRDETFKGMNEGSTLWELMDRIRLPSQIAIPQGHGKVPWIVRAIWEEHLGWFRYESSTELYSVPAQALYPEWVELAGGTAPVIARARAYLDAGEPLKALHMAEAVDAADKGSAAAAQIMLESNRAILAAAGRENFSEVRWLESEISRLESLTRAAAR
jgi:alkyl sulfatase BDS1-like metallo-beta-lactamase superfamily hydrolase